MVLNNFCKVLKYIHIRCAFKGESVFKVTSSCNLNAALQVESCFTSSDTHVMSGSEDGYVYCWDLVQSTLTNKWVTLNQNSMRVY